MDDDIIDDLAAAFAGQIDFVLRSSPHRQDWYNAILDDIIAIAGVIHSHTPTYDMRYYYKNAGYPEPYPVHDMH